MEGRRIINVGGVPVLNNPPAFLPPTAPLLPLPLNAMDALLTLRLRPLPWYSFAS